MKAPVSLSSSQEAAGPLRCGACPERRPPPRPFSWSMRWTTNCCPRSGRVSLSSIRRTGPYGRATGRRSFGIVVTALEDPNRPKWKAALGDSLRPSHTQAGSPHSVTERLLPGRFRI
jgi:hypothetical protein